MKKIFLKPILILLAIASIQMDIMAQFTDENFDVEILKYTPIKTHDVSEEDFKEGKFFLKAAVDQVKENRNEFTYSDYWNLTMALISLNASKKAIEIPFKKAVAQNSEAICQYVESFGQEAIVKLSNSIPDFFPPFWSQCNNEVKTNNSPFDCSTYAKENNLDHDLVRLMYQIDVNDQKHRQSSPVDWSKQTPIDQENLRLIDSAFTKHNQYIGRSLVGEKFEHTMWLVIQHSNITTMEKYLPYIHQAVQNGELHSTPLKMLLDRIHCIKYDYQFFKSQYGEDCRVASPEKIKRIKEQYDLE